MLQVELTGCTGAGKSTLTSRLLRMCRDQGIDAWIDYDFVLGQVRLDWIKSKLARALVVNLVSLCVCLVTWRNYREFYRFMIRVISRLPVAWSEKLYVGRNVLKNMGIHEIIRRCASDQQIVFLDEGTLHIAHYLFVHVSVEPDTEGLSTFVELVPLPDVVVYVSQTERVLIERTLARGHKRVPIRSYAQVELFIKRAIETFEELRQQSVLQSRLIVVDSQRKIIVGQDYPKDAPFADVLKMVRAGVEMVSTECSRGVMPVLDSRTAV